MGSFEATITAAHLTDPRHLTPPIRSTWSRHVDKGPPFCPLHDIQSATGILYVQLPLMEVDQRPAWYLWAVLDVILHLDSSTVPVVSQQLAADATLQPCGAVLCTTRCAYPQEAWHTLRIPSYEQTHLA